MTAAINAGRALGVLALLTLPMVLGASAALAETPQPVITQPAADSWTKLQKPTFSMTSNDRLDPLTLRIYAGAAAEGAALQTLQTLLPPIGEGWSLEVEAALDAGIYTAVAEQTNGESETGLSVPVMFTVDRVAPKPSLVSPGALITDSGPTLHGSAGTIPGDLPAISLLVHKGPTTSGAVVTKASPEAQGGAWSQKLATLPDGTYTAQAFQTDQAGNLGTSEAVTFTIDATPPAPSISLPSYGSVLSVARPGFSGLGGIAEGDRPSLSLDVYAVGPGRSETLVESLGPLIVKEGAWSTGQAGKDLPDGIYTAQVRQSDEAGNTGLSEPLLFVIEARPLAKTEAPAPQPQPAPAPVGPAAPAAPAVRWLQPFPVVRIAGSETTAGARISLLSVVAPVGARVTVTCRGRGCPIRSEGVLAGAGHVNASGTQVIAFRRLQRSLRAGVVLEIRVSRAGQIGKFVRFVIRHGKLPTRQDSCLDPSAGTPMACPRS
jgi:hypothetical protein